MKNIIAVVIIMGVSIALAGCVGSGSSGAYDGKSVSELRSISIDPGYDAVYKSIGQYRGKVVHIIGEVLQAQPDGTGYVLRVATIQSQYGNYMDGIYWVNYDGASGVVRDSDHVDIYGEVLGLKTYTAVLGNSMTIPEIKALSMSSHPKPTPTPTLDPASNMVLTFDSLDYEGDYSKYNVARGSVKNTASKTVSYASVQVKFLESEDGPIIATSSDYVSNLGPGETFEFKVVNYKDSERVHNARADIVNARYV